MKTESSAQQQLNQRAAALGGKVEIFHGWIFTDKDGAWYRVQTQAQLYALISNLESEAKDGN